jgi:outer membrane immunogenic protein
LQQHPTNKGQINMMNKTIRAAIAVTALLIAPIAAQAADLSRPNYKAPEYIAPMFSWSGFYVGLNGGYMLGSSQWSGTSNFEVSPKGWLGGGTIGYNFQTGTWVWGIEGDMDYAALKGTNDSAVCTGCLFKETWISTIRGRVGYAADRWLPYLTGGLAYGNMYMQGPAGGSQNKTKAGWTAGAGVEYALSGPWSAKLEYLYVDLGSATCGMASCGLATDETVKFKANIVKAGLNYRF